MKMIIQQGKEWFQISLDDKLINIAWEKSSLFKNTYNKYFVVNKNIYFIKSCMKPWEKNS